MKFISLRVRIMLKQMFLISTFSSNFKQISKDLLQNFAITVFKLNWVYLLNFI